MPVGGGPYCEGVLLFGIGINTIPKLAELGSLHLQAVWVIHQ